MISELTPQELRAAHLLALLSRDLSWRAFEETANEMLALESQILTEKKRKKKLS